MKVGKGTFSDTSFFAMTEQTTPAVTQPNLWMASPSVGHNIVAQLFIPRHPADKSGTPETFPDIRRTNREIPKPSPTSGEQIGKSRNLPRHPANKTQTRYTKLSIFFIF
jgi:hypothetical protein